ncbi:hypothetical protein NE237_017840 [Protea cynaroides]|uniref:Uncharacterized protein n=1 Tax=Protea cynaroides TaxID=273540 RepID=A0A9Q0K8V9_9MAGN|nr:hypothetical protein NE237_017840 [Protea cynaroides]
MAAFAYQQMLSSSLGIDIVVTVHVIDRLCKSGTYHKCESPCCEEAHELIPVVEEVVFGFVDDSSILELQLNSSLPLRTEQIDSILEVPVGPTFDHGVTVHKTILVKDAQHVLTNGNQYSLVDSAHYFSLQDDQVSLFNGEIEGNQYFFGY